jgi:hypothetical protein
VLCERSYNIYLRDDIKEVTLQGRAKEINCNFTLFSLSNVLTRVLISHTQSEARGYGNPLMEFIQAF